MKNIKRIFTVLVLVLVFAFLSLALIQSCSPTSISAKNKKTIQSTFNETKNVKIETLEQRFNWILYKTTVDSLQYIMVIHSHGAAITKHLSTFNETKKVKIETLEQRFNWILYKVTVDSSQYLIIISGNGVAITKT